jgi:hypothetical protein
MPNRYIREGIIESKRVNALSWQAEVFYRRLLNRVDDFGRYTADRDLLRASLFPMQLNKVSEADIDRLLLECEKSDLVSRWKGEDAKEYLAMNKWEKGRALNSKYPDPPPSVGTCKHVRTYVPDPDPDPDPDRTPPPTRAREPSSELPPRLQAVSMTAPAGVDTEFAGYVYDDWHGRGGKDGAGIEVAWLHYVTKRWTRERKEWQAGTHKGNGHATTAQRQPASYGANVVVLGKELERVIDRMKTIKATYGDHQSWAKADVAEFGRLKARRAELRQVLGVKV